MLASSVRTAAGLALAAAMGLGFLGLLLADAADETSVETQLRLGINSETEFNGEGTAFRVCFSTMDNEFVTFKPAPVEEGKVTNLEDLDGVDLAMPDFLRYFAGIEVEIVAAFVL